MSHVQAYTSDRERGGEESHSDSIDQHTPQYIPEWRCQKSCTCQSGDHLRGTIDMLRENWIYQYSQETKPMDIIVVAGLNDLTTLSEEEFVEKIATFKRIVIQQNGTNLFTFAEMLQYYNITSTK